VDHDQRAEILPDGRDQNRGEWNTEPPPPFAEMVRLFEQWLSELVDGVERLDDASWDRVAKFYANGKVVNEQPVGQFLWYILFDAIHHRGQLSAYLRPMAEGPTHLRSVGG